MTKILEEADGKILSISNEVLIGAFLLVVVFVGFIVWKLIDVRNERETRRKPPKKLKKAQ